MKTILNQSHHQFECGRSTKAQCTQNLYSIYISLWFAIMAVVFVVLVLFGECPKVFFLSLFLTFQNLLCYGQSNKTSSDCKCFTTYQTILSCVNTYNIYIFLYVYIHLFKYILCRPGCLYVCLLAVCSLARLLLCLNW